MTFEEGVALAAFAVLLAFGSWSDFRARRVSNRLVLGLSILGLAAAAAGVAPVDSPIAALGGATVGLSLWLPLWLFGLLGAGDVKFFAAGSLWIGPSLSWRAAIVAALLGGVMAVFVMMRRSGVRDAMSRIFVQTAHYKELIASADVGGSDARVRTFPYAVPMALALFLAAAHPSWLYAFIQEVR